MVVVAAVCPLFPPYNEYLFYLLLGYVAEGVSSFVFVAWFVLYNFKSFHAKRQVSVF